MKTEVTLIPIFLSIHFLVELREMPVRRAYSVHPFRYSVWTY